MPAINLRIGIVDVQLPILDEVNTVPDLNSATPTVCSIATDDLFLNDINSPLVSGDTISVIIGLVGADILNKGYTVARCSNAASMTIDGNKTVQVIMPYATMGGSFDEAVAVAVFVKFNAATLYQLQGFGYIDSNATNFTYIIDSKPLRAAPSFTSTILQALTVDPTLGSRVGYGYTYETLTPTTGDMTENFPTVQVPVSPNTGPDFNIRTTVSEGFSFQLLQNDLRSFIRAGGGNYVEYTYGGVRHRQGHTALATAQAIIRGNQPMKINFPPDSSGFAETKLLIGNLTFNQQEFTAAWSKTAPTPVTFVFQPAVLDKLITNSHTAISHYREA